MIKYYIGVIKIKEYSTSEIAKEIGIHTNTVRFYEDIEFLPKIPRKSNRYRVYNEVHLEQLKLIKIALESELLQNGLRKQVINIIKASARAEYDIALNLSKEHMNSILKEQKNAKESIKIVKEILSGTESIINNNEYKRKELADKLGLTLDTLRNWELNGLLKIKRKENRYRIYDEFDIQRIKVISSLRCANFSLSSILRLLNELDKNSNIDVEYIIDTPKQEEDIISVCDKLITSLEKAKEESYQITELLEKMKKINPPV